MKLALWMLLLLLLLLDVTGFTSAVPDQYSRAVDWLSRYGYLPPPDPRTSRLQTREGIENAIRVMQRFGGLPETGLLDRKTLELMSTPRCSLPDVVGGEDMRRRRRRRKRYALSGLKWHKTDLTWRIHSYPQQQSSQRLDPQLVDSLLTHALKAWSDVAPLTFRRLQGSSGSGSEGEAADGDIRISFTRLLHEDGYPFDGMGGTLAHAFFPGVDPISGDTHFDDDEIWSYGGDSSSGSSTDLFTVAVHEFGHALGLSHSSSDPSIMRPYYQGPVGEVSTFQLALDDKLAIQQLYGLRDSGGKDPDLPRLPTQPAPRPTKHADPSLNERCRGGFDAIANIRGEVFFFKGSQFWRTKRDGSLLSLKPAQIKNFWFGLPADVTRVDAVYERSSDSRIVFFIGDQYWVFKDTQAMSGYPRPLSDWGLRTPSGAVDRVDAAFVWAHNGKTYLFSDEMFWRFDERPRDGQANRHLEPGYPRNNSLWEGMPTRMDDVISWGDGDAYFFKDNLYWVLMKGGMAQDFASSKSTAVDFLKCPAAPPTPAPPTPREPRKCRCDLSSSSSTSFSFFLISAALMMILMVI